MGEMLGANPDQLRKLAKAMGDGAEQLRSVTATLQGVVQNVPWAGADATSLRADWKSAHAPKLLKAQSLLSEHAQLLLRQSDEQERASASSGGGISVGSGKDLPGNPDTDFDHQPFGDISEDREDMESSDIYQGQLGDCWFLAGLGAVASQDPEFLAEHITRNEDGTYTVRFYKDGEPVDITVEATRVEEFARGDNGVANYATVYEKAAAEFFGGSYSDIDGDDPAKAIEAITGESARTEGDLSFDEIEERMADGPVVAATEMGEDGGWYDFWTDTVDDQQIVGNHAYIVEEITERDGERMIHLRNPWGPDGGTASDGEHKVGDIWLTEEEYRENFANISSVDK